MSHDVLGSRLSEVVGILWSAGLHSLLRAGWGGTVLSAMLVAVIPNHGLGEWGASCAASVRLGGQ